MSTPQPQSFRNHARLDPIYHFISTAGLVFNLVLAVIILIKDWHSQLLLSLWVFVLSLTMFLIFFRLRTYPLKVQDRVIRLEERLRLAALLPESLKRRIPELSEDQLLGLRFASDAELPTLVEMTLDKKLNRKQIKERIQAWRPDYWRV
jgi:hypothetical protein